MTLARTGPIGALEAVDFHYPDNSRGLVQCTLALQRGSRTVLLGPNGAGKTTLFLHLNGILRPQRGTVQFDGVPVDYSRHGLRCLRSRVGLVFQNPDSQLVSASVREDVSFGPCNLGLDRATVSRRVAEALAVVGMGDHADRPVHSLSFGQKKRVCIAGVLAMEPELLLLDEPMAGLDPAMQGELEQLLDRLHRQGMTIVMATHDIDFTYRWADQVCLLAEGECRAQWEGAALPEVRDQLRQWGLGVPQVIQLHRLLVAQGGIPATAPAPRSHKMLLESILTGAVKA